MDQYRVIPGSTPTLADIDPADAGDWEGRRSEAEARQKTLAKELARLQRVLWAQHRHKVLVVFQAMDTGGKDGTIRRVFGRVNPQGVKVANFKKPTAKELAHDYLWRIHHHTPGTGEIAIFNRSHYEDVLVVRVLDLVPESVWSKRYDHIVAFERRLADEGTTIVKFYLHIDAAEQKQRLQARLDDPEKQWKFNPGDLDHRELWGDYMAAYEDAIVATSTEQAPWYIVPANRKWYRNLVVTETVVETMRALDLRYPEPEEDLEGITIV